MKIDPSLARYARFSDQMPAAKRAELHRRCLALNERALLEPGLVKRRGPEAREAVALAVAAHRALAELFERKAAQPAPGQPGARP